MLGGFFKLTLSLHVLILFVTLLWQVATANTSSNLAIDNSLAKSNEEISHLLANTNEQKSVNLVNPSLNPAVSHKSLLNKKRTHSRSRRRYRKKLHPNTELPNSSNGIQSEGRHNRLKRFRMLNPEEFQEMLSSMSQQQPDEQRTGYNPMNTLDGIQLENYWSRK
ncbi:unnamed protein product [Adineta steineri]|uniref:Uncharacterized protein n=2 Tax=Adineta steineri TaxID=433720 RepID=A0A819Q988_9BILA|nr:unnamed protein product [Adineta steineri]CAF3690270.1 unnamed protein product [Adineta steineri]CAF4020995.1 unnamed protein product [Adineta steineri]